MSALAGRGARRIEAPKPRMLASIPLRFVRKPGQGGKPISQDLPLVPFVDFLITLVVFLLMSFSTSGELRASDSITLPAAASRMALEQAPIVTVDQGAILLDGRRLAAMSDVLERGDGSAIGPLVEALRSEARTCRALHRTCAGLALLAVDRGTDMRALRRVIVSAAAAGYPNVGFVVNRR